MAAAHVFAFHYLSTLKRDGLLASMLGGEWLLAPWVEGLWRTGYVAVSLFFVLSGFILTYTYFDAHGQRRATVKEFWVARLARVYPAYLFGLLFCMAMLAVLRIAFPEQALATTSVDHKLAAIRPEGPLETLLHAGMLQAWVPLHTRFWNVPGWTIGTEAFFYFLFPFVAPAIFKRFSGARLIGLGALFWGVSLTTSTLYIVLDPDGIGSANPGSVATWIYLLKFFPPVRLPEFLIGICAGKLYLDDLRQGRRRPGGLLTAVALLLILGSLVLSPYLPYPLMHNGLLAPLFTLLVYGLAHGGGRWHWLLSRRISVYLGEISYGFYLFHWPFRALIMTLLLRGAVDPTLGFAGYTAGTLVTAALTFHYLETPARRALRSLLAAPRRVPAAGAATS